MSGQHNINVGLNVQFNTENSKQLSQLNATLGEANKSQIAQNEKINQLLKEIGKSTNVTTTEIVKETRATRDATASMNAWSKANVMLKSTLYANVGVLRNLGEMVVKTITVWMPWTRIIDALEKTWEFLKEIRGALVDIIREDARFEPTIWEKLDLKTAIDDINELNKQFGYFWNFGDVHLQKTPKQELAERKKQLADLKTEYDEAVLNQTQLEEKTNTAWNNTIKIQTALEKMYDDAHRSFNMPTKKGVGALVDFLFNTGTTIERSIVGSAKEALAKGALQDDLAKAEANYLQLAFQKAVGESAQGGEVDQFRIFLQNRIAVLEEIVKGEGRTTTPKKKLEEFKDYYGDISWFIEQWEESTLIKEKNWLTDLEKWRRDAYRRRDKDAKTQWEKWKSAWLIRETFLNKYIANAKKQREEVQKIQDEILTKYNGAEKQNEGAAYLESEAKRRASLLTLDYLNVNLKKTSEFEKRQIANMEKDLTNSLKQASDQAWNTLQQKLKEYDKVIKQQDEILARPDLDTNQQYRAWTIQNMMRDKSKEAWKEYYDYLDERSHNLAEAEKKIADERAKQWSDQFRYINKDAEYWKGTKKAMDAIIEATTELGASEKAIHAISNYAKGIEASVDAMNIAADGLKLFAVGDIKGGVAMEAAALAKATAAAAYFKNAIDLGGRGGSAPNVSAQSYTGTDNKDRSITINMAFEGTAGAVIGPLADAFNAQASVPGGVRLNSNIIRRR